jgi:hypothetical protein
VLSGGAVSHRFHGDQGVSGIAGSLAGAPARGRDRGLRP